MADKLKLLVMDDHISNADTNIERIGRATSSAGAAVDVTRLDKERAVALIDAIGKVDPSDPNTDIATWFDALKEFESADILFLDYQLRDFDDHAWLTAENLAGVIRAFGGVRQVVILNRFHDVDFDLGMAGWPGTSADLHLNDRFLANSGLWALPDPSDQRTAAIRFRPWHWPLLPRAVADTETCRSELEGLNLADDAVLAHLGLDGPTAPLPHAALGALNPSSKTPEKTTFSEFLRYGCKGLDEGIRTLLSERLDDPAFKRVASRVIASELRRWLSFFVLGPQDILIDPPHLAQRMPWLLDGPLDSLDTWNETVALDRVRGFREDLVSKYRYTDREHWFSRVVLWVRGLQADDAIYAAFEAFEGDGGGTAAFQEDFSRFSPTDESAEFAAAFNSVWANRFVSSTALDDGAVAYAPKVRLI